MKGIAGFLLLGVVSTLADYVVYSLMMYAGVFYVYAIVIGYSSGFVVNFYGGRIFIFKRGAKVRHFGAELGAVFVIAFMGLLINIGIVKLLSYSLFNLDPYLSRLVGIGVAFFWNYAARKWFVYH